MSLNNEKHIYRFSSDGSGGYYKLWLWLFDSGLFARVHASSWRVYCKLLSLADFNSGQVLVSHRDLAEACGLQRQRLPEIIGQLSAFDMVSCQRRITAARGKEVNRYYIAVPPENTMPGNAVSYIGEVVADSPVDIAVRSEKGLPGHVRLAAELFRNGYFSDLEKNHSTWKVYCGLLFRADFQTGYCFPSLETIAVDTGLSVPTIIKSLEQLASDNLVRIIKYQSNSGKIANGYYIWPYDLDLKKRTWTTKKSGHGGVKNTDMPDLKKRTTNDVRYFESNINTTNNITTTTKTEQERGFSAIIEKISDQYLSGNIRRGMQSRQEILSSVEDWVIRYGEKLVTGVIRNNTEIYSAKAMGNLIENASILSVKKQQQREQEEIRLQEQSRTLVVAEQREFEPVKLRTRTDVIESYRKLLKERDDSFIRHRLEVLLREEEKELQK